MWIGFNLVLVEYLLLAAIVGGVMGVLIIVYRKSPLSALTGTNMFLRHFADDKAGVPYGVALGIGGLMVFPKTALMVWALAQI